MRYIYPEDLPGLLKDIELTIAGRHNPYMFRIIRKNGDISYVHTTSRPIIKNGQVTGINGLMIDIAKLKEVEFKLKEERDKVQRYLDIVGVIILALDRDGNISLINKKGSEVLGYDEEEITFKNWFDIAIPEKLVEVAKKNYSDLMEGNIDIIEYFERPIITKNGDQRTFAWHNIILKDKFGNIIGTLSSGEDITERKKAEDALITAKLISDNALRTKKEFISNISHELRTPLNLIIGFSELLYQEHLGNMNDKQKNSAEIIKKSGDRLLELVNSMMELSNIEKGKTEVQKKDVSLPLMIREIEVATLPMATKKNIVLEFDLELSIGIVAIDPDKFKTILYNLINNAIKFTPENGEVRVNIHKSEKNLLETSITDTGIGIPAEDHDKLFQPFSQIDSSLTRKFEGAGLGLTVVKEFVEMQGGTVWFESEPGKGSTFTFTIPLHT